MKTKFTFQPGWTPQHQSTCYSSRKYGMRESECWVVFFFFMFLCSIHLSLQGLSSPVLPPLNCQGSTRYAWDWWTPPFVVARSFQRILRISIQVRTRRVCCWDTDWNGGGSSWQPVPAALGSPNRSTKFSGLLDGLFSQFSNYFEVSYGLCTFQENCSHWRHPLYRSSVQAFAWTYTPLS